MDGKKFSWLKIVTLLWLILFVDVNFGITRQQFKSSVKFMKKTCIKKHNVTEEDVGTIEQGKFLEERSVMCYIACIYSMTQSVKNNKVNHENMVKNVELMFPAEMQEPVKASIAHCKYVAKEYTDVCEASYWTAKCFYEYDKINFFFP